MDNFEFNNNQDFRLKNSSRLFSVVDLDNLYGGGNLGGFGSRPKPIERPKSNYQYLNKAAYGNDEYSFIQGYIEKQKMN